MDKEKIIIPNFYEFLKMKNLEAHHLTDSELDSLKVEYKKHRNVLYKKRQRQTHNVVEILLTKNEMNYFKQKAYEHNIYLSHFIKLTAQKYCEQSFIVPDRIAFQQIMKSLNKIEESIEKIQSQKVSRLSLSDSKYEGLTRLINEIKFNVLQNITNPINVNLWFEKELNENPFFRKKIIRRLLNYDEI